MPTDCVLIVEGEIDEFIWVYDDDEDLRIQNKQIYYNEFEWEGDTYSFGEWAPYKWFEEGAEVFIDMLKYC